MTANCTLPKKEEEETELATTQTNQSKYIIWADN
jgi:hypothetical protein